MSLDSVFCLVISFVWLGLRLDWLSFLWGIFGILCCSIQRLQLTNLCITQIGVSLFLQSYFVTYTCGKYRISPFGAGFFGEFFSIFSTILFWYPWVMNWYKDVWDLFILIKKNWINIITFLKLMNKNWVMSYLIDICRVAACTTICMSPSVWCR